MIAAALGFPLSGLVAVSLRLSVAIALLIALKPFLQKRIGSRGVALLWMVLALSFAVPWPTFTGWNLPAGWFARHGPVPTVLTVPETMPTAPVRMRPERRGMPASPLARPASAVAAILAQTASPVRLDRWNVLWLAGLILSLGRLGWHWRKTAGWVHRTTPVAEGSPFAKAFTSLPPALRAGVELRLAETLAVPTLTGIFPARICLPRAWLDRLDADETRHVLLHELGHVRRRDLPAQWLWALVCCLHWFNPLVWLAARLARSDRELACDAWVLAREPDNAFAARYGGTLLKVVDWLREPASAASPAVVTMAAGRRHLTRRVREIGAFRPVGAWRGNLAALGAFALVAALATARLVAGPVESTPPASGAGKSAHLPEGIRLTAKAADDALEIDARIVSFAPADLERLAGAWRAKDRPAGEAEFAGVLDGIFKEAGSAPPADKAAPRLQISGTFLPERARRMFALLDALPPGAAVVTPPVRVAVKPGQLASFGLTRAVRYPRRWENNPAGDSYVLADSGMADIGIVWQATAVPQVPDLSLDLSVSGDVSSLEDPGVLLPPKPGEQPRISNFRSEHLPNVSISNYAGSTVLLSCKAVLPVELGSRNASAPMEERWLLAFLTPHLAAAPPRPKVEIKSQYFTLTRPAVERLAALSGLSPDETELFHQLAEDFAVWQRDGSLRKLPARIVDAAKLEHILGRLRGQEGSREKSVGRSTVVPEMTAVTEQADFIYPTAFDRSADGKVVGKDFAREKIGMSLGAGLRRPTTPGTMDVDIVCRHSELLNPADFQPPATGEPVGHKARFAVQDASLFLRVSDGSTVILGGMGRSPGAWDEPAFGLRPVDEAQLVLAFVTVRNVLVAAPSDYTGQETAGTAPASPLYAESAGDKPGFVANPYAPESGLVDVRGLGRGTRIQDPFTGRMFLVP